MICTLFEPQTQLISPEQYQSLFSSVQTTKDSGILINNVTPKYQSANGVKIKL
jgi:hypothetical protein